MTKIENINGTITANQLVDLKNTRIAWNGEPNRKYEKALAELCRQGIADLGDDLEFDAVEIENGEIKSLVKL